MSKKEELLFAERLIRFETTDRKTQQTRKVIIDTLMNSKYANFELSKCILCINRNKPLDDWFNAMLVTAYKAKEVLELDVSIENAAKEGNTDIFGNELKEGDFVNAIFFNRKTYQNEVFKCEVKANNNRLCFMISAIMFTIPEVLTLDIPFWLVGCEQMKDALYPGNAVNESTDTANNTNNHHRLDKGNALDDTQATEYIPTT